MTIAEKPATRDGGPEKVMASGKNTIGQDKKQISRNRKSDAAGDHREVRSVLIIDDHPLIRLGVKLLINTSFPNAVTMEAGDTQEAHSYLEKADWSVILLDIVLPGRSGIEFLPELKKRLPSVPVLVFSVHTDGEYIVRSFRNGAAGYLAKEASPDELTTAIATVVGGDKYISRNLSHALATYIACEGSGDLHGDLTDRELLIFLRLANGQTISEIAAELSLSVKTISTHRRHILEKLCLRNNGELVRYALRHGVIQ